MKLNKINLVDVSGWLVVLAVFLIGLWVIVILPLGPHFARLPGDLGDTRFNNYILEHDFRWITGKDASLWNAPYFFPYRETLTFSDNHLGSALFYAAFRWVGLGRESALQGWYLLSFILNFGAAAFVLNRLKLRPLAVGVGAFFFTFALPVLAQENHIQLAYRFCIPLACYALWLFSQSPRFKTIAWLSAGWVWQFYISIYLGYFLSLLLVALAVCLPFAYGKSLPEILRYWPNLFKQAWQSAKVKTHRAYLAAAAAIFLSLAFLFQPYMAVMQAYSFKRPWSEVSKMLPKVSSYLISDSSKIWHLLPTLTDNITSLRNEHQLFIGMVASLLIIAGLIWRFPTPQRKTAMLFLGAAGILVLLTLSVGGYSLYKILWHLPGVNSIRAVSRIILVLLWPVAVFIAIETDALLRLPTQAINVTAAALLLLGLMMGDSMYYRHTTFLKAEADARLQALRAKIPVSPPEQPILFAWYPHTKDWMLNELDAMLVAQDLGWPVLNGYSGNWPDGYGPTNSCRRAAVRIRYAMDFEKINDPALYNTLIARVVPVGPEPCQPANEP